MKCVYCGYMESKVVDSRPTEEGSSIRRRRECLSCKKRFTTYEKIDSAFTGHQKERRSRPVHSDKIKIRHQRREKRPVPMRILTLVSVETIFNSLRQEVTSESARLVMKGLKELDGVAYVPSHPSTRSSGRRHLYAELRRLLEEK